MDLATQQQLTTDRSRQALESLRDLGGEALVERGIAAARRTRTLEWSLAGLERILTARFVRGLRLPTNRGIGLAAALAGGSDLFPRLLCRRPRLLDWLARLPALGPASREELLAALQARLRRGAPGDRAGLARRLRRFKYEQLLRIGARELIEGADIAAVTRELTRLAEAMLEATVQSLDRDLRVQYGAPEGSEVPGQGFCIFGLGKLGAGELNFSSDVDLLLVYDRHGRTAGGTRGALTHFEYWARLGESLVRALGEITEEGFVYRVDLGLRPDGRSGPIVCSADALEDYYAAFGRSWERAAWVRARPVAGDRALGEKVLTSLEPFVWRRSLDLGAVHELRDLKARIERQARSEARDLKRGPGGIREVEFFVHALQLLYGGRNPRLRERSTLGALSSALFAGLISAHEHDALADAYLVLRKVEHRLQTVAERQTHALPESYEERLRLARALGFDGWESLASELGRHRAAVSEIFAGLLQAAGAAPAPPDERLEEALDPDAPDARRREALGERGFRAPEEALEHLRRLARARGTPFAFRERSADAARLLRDCATSPDPDLALLHLSDFFAALRVPGPYAQLLVEHPATARLLTSLFGTSDFLSKYFVRHPELLEALLRSDRAPGPKGPGRLGRELAARLEAQDSLEGRLMAMRRFKNEEVLRVGLQDVAGELKLEEVLEELASLAGTLLEASLELARRELDERYGTPHLADGASSAFVVMALGKLGGRELGYGSDLDLLFLYSGPGETSGGARGKVSNAEFFARLAQRLLSHLSTQLREGALYRTDVRLRPSGNQGLLVVTEEAFAAHHRRAQTWERQALLKARPVAGDHALFERVRDASIVPAAFADAPDVARLSEEIVHMRERLERESARESRRHWDPKLGRGGLVDIEFAVQFLQLAHGGRHPAVRSTGTFPALRALQAEGLLPPEVAETLERGLAFYRLLETRLRIVHDSPLQQLPVEPFALQALARRMGYSGDDAGERLRREYEATREAVREAFTRVLEGAKRA